MEVKSIKSIKSIKSLEELNREFTAENRESKSRMVQTIPYTLFCLAILAVLSLAFTYSHSDTPKMFMGYSYFTVTSSSMQDEIPKGSLILTHKTEPDKLKVGDNITYMRDPNITVTHKIEAIFENHQNSGIMGFLTKGVNNTVPDNEIVREGDIIGKVIFTIPAIGAAMAYLVANIHIVYIIFGLCVILYFAIQKQKKGKEKNNEKRNEVKTSRRKIRYSFL